HDSQYGEGGRQRSFVAAPDQPLMKIGSGAGSGSHVVRVRPEGKGSSERAQRWLNALPWRRRGDKFRAHVKRWSQHAEPHVEPPLQLIVPQAEHVIVGASQSVLRLRSDEGVE